MKINPNVKRLVERIVEISHPLRIVLFGSLARRDDGQESDIDLLIVMPEGVHRRKTAQDLYRRLTGVLTPFDLIVATPSVLERHKDNNGLIYREILREGVEVYAA